MGGAANDCLLRVTPLARRSVLTAGMAAALVGCSNPETPAGPAEAGLRTPDPNPTHPPRSASPSLGPVKPVDFTTLEFEDFDRFRPVHLASPNLAVVELADAGEVFTMSRDPATVTAPYAAVEMTVLAGRGVARCGLTSPAGDGFQVSLAGGQLRLEVVVEGRATILGASPAAVPTTVALVVAGGRPTAFVDDGDGWSPVLVGGDAVLERLDLRRPERLAELAYTWGASDGVVRLGAVRAGPFGALGLRDPHLVQHSDGRPYRRDGRIFFTWTCAGPGFFPQASWGVWSMDPDDPRSLAHVAAIYARRGGLVLGDHAGQLVRHEGRWLVLNSSWGDFDFDGISARRAETRADLLSGVHVLDTVPLDLPVSQGAWDPGLTRDADGWQLSFVESPSQDPFIFHPAVAVTTTTSPWDDLTLRGAATTLTQTEGPILVSDGQQLRLLASDGAKDARTYRIFDLDLGELGRLDAPYGTSIPHPQLVRRSDDWLMVTFDGANPFGDQVGYGAHGDVVVLRSRPAERHGR